jgi:hypothetical protein
MINFSRGTTRPRTAVQQQTVVPVVEETIVVRPALRRADTAPEQRQLGWKQLRDYVIGQIEATSGPFPRDIRRENTIFMGFADRWREAEAIARYAFEECGGIWKGAPVSVARFSETSDSYFAGPIALLINN